MATNPSIHSLDRLVLAVPDLEEAARFYTAFGLDVTPNGDALEVRTFGKEHVWMDLRHGPAKRICAIRLGFHEADRDALTRRVTDVRIAAPYGPEDRLWCRAHDGLAVELVAAPKSSPAEKSEFRLPDRASTIRGASPRHQCQIVRPARLAHIGLFTPDVSGAIEFYTHYLGLRLSDRSGDDVAFLHGAHGSDHHMLAFVHSPGIGLHHSSWDVPSIAEIGLGAMQMADAGYVAGWGLGRHVLGSNYFHYVRDPWGSYAEYSADMDFIPAGSAWAAADHPEEDGYFQWGPPAPADMIHNYELS